MTYTKDCESKRCGSGCARARARACATLGGGPRRWDPRPLMEGRTRSGGPRRGRTSKQPSRQPRGGGDPPPMRCMGRARERTSHSARRPPIHLPKICPPSQSDGRQMRQGGRGASPPGDRGHMCPRTNHPKDLSLCPRRGHRRDPSWTGRPLKPAPLEAGRREATGPWRAGGGSHSTKNAAPPFPCLRSRRARFSGPHGAGAANRKGGAEGGYAAFGRPADLAEK
jgi:hypothetical protein